MAAKKTKLDLELAKVLLPGQQMRIQQVEGWGVLVEILDRNTDVQKKAIAETFGRALSTLAAE